MKKLILSVLLFLLVASSTGCTILNDSQSSIENDDKLIIDQTSTKNTSNVLIQALETNDAELFKSVFSEQTLKLQPDIDEGIKYIFNILKRFDNKYYKTLLRKLKVLIFYKEPVII